MPTDGCAGDIIDLAAAAATVAAYVARSFACLYGHFFRVRTLQQVMDPVGDGFGHVLDCFTAVNQPIKSSGSLSAKRRVLLSSASSPVRHSFS